MSAVAVALAIGWIFGAAGTAQSFEGFDGRVQAHGFFESQMRALNADYSEDWDVAQWYMVFNLELELDLVQDTIGPIDLLSAYVRAEVRYDCVYSSGCGMFRSMNTYGDRAKSLPRRLNGNAARVTQSGRIRVPNAQRTYLFDDDNNPTGETTPSSRVPDQYRNYGNFNRKFPGQTSSDLTARRGWGTNTDPVRAESDAVFGIFANATGADLIAPRDECVGPVCDYIAGGGGTAGSFDVGTIWPDNDNPYEAIAREGNYFDFVFVAPAATVGAGPWLPKNHFIENGAGASVANPFDDRFGNYNLQANVYNGYVIPRIDPVTGTPIDPATGLPDPSTTIEQILRDGTALAVNAVGAGELPYRPAPLFRENGAGVDQAQQAGDARGLFLPTATLSERLNKGQIDSISQDYNLSESRRAWNRGASQRSEKELKEAYLDIETFDNRLWLRIGRQQIVWGKTELFRTTDQFNPTDAALASLPSLEESRIAMWSARGVWSFYEVGPIDDVRLELAFNFDDYQQIDIGACGEAYAPNVTCALTFGTFAHSTFGYGIVGAEEPPKPWQSLKGWEVGARLEWRYDRFSFALVDFYGYDDLPIVELITSYTRNVDPQSGRPRGIFSTLETTRPSIDPYTGSPISNVEQIGTQGICVTGIEEACLLPKADLDGDGIISTANVFEDANGNGLLDLGEDVDGDGVLDFGSEAEALTHGPTAQQVFAYTCAAGVGFSDLDRAACSLNIFGSAEPVPPGLTSVAQGLGTILAGGPFVNLAVLAPAAGGFIFPFVRLDVDTDDLEGNFNPATNGSTTPCMDNGTECGGQGSGLLVGLTTSRLPNGRAVIAQTLGGVLSPAQEALLGCGPFWGTQCDDSGLDLLTAEGSALFQAWPGVEGTVQDGDITKPWLTNTRVTSPITGGEIFAQQPGTRGWYFDRTRDHAIGPVCSTGNFGGQLFEYEDDDLENDAANGNQAVLPGCRRRWKADPDDPAFAGANQILALNLYGQDLSCARLRAAGVPINSGDPCEDLGDFTSRRVDPRSWDATKDGNPDTLSLQNVDFGSNFLAPPTVTLTPTRDIGGTQISAPDFFYANYNEFILGGFPVYGSQAGSAAATAAGRAFDNCDASGYPAELIAEHGGAAFVPCGRGGHPMTGQPFATEIGVVSWNFMALLVQLELQVEYDDLIEVCAANPGADPRCGPASDPTSDYERARAIFLDPDACSFVQPGLCDTFRTLQGAIGLQRNVRKSGGNGTHGRRTFIWQSGGEAIITYNKRNVLGFSMDFAEDFTKSNFSFEFTWINDVVVANRNQYDDLDTADDFNLTMSVDRPTFINFLNSNRTFFFNWQFFMRYRDGWKKGYTDEGAWNFLTTFAVATGYFQDRLTPSIVSVYDISTQSGALLTGISYRFTQNFSAAVGMAFFYGKPDNVDEPIAGIAPAGNRSQSRPEDLYKNQRFGGLSIVTDRDELWARVRYTF